MNTNKSISSEQNTSSIDNEEYHQGYIAIGTKEAKPQNEDFCNFYKGNILSAIAIADGVGSSIDSHKAAKCAVEIFLHEVESFDNSVQKEIEFKDIEVFWRKIVKQFNIFYEKNKKKYQNNLSFLETTLITIIELKDRYLISYLGNGSVLYIRGDFWHFWNKQWPWCISELMIGHSILNENGKDVLYGLLRPKEDTLGMRLLTITKDIHCGEIFILTTDGISSPDHSKLGRDPNDKLWLEINPHIENLVNVYLKEYLENFSKKDDSKLLEDIIKKFLNEEEFDDDATLGIIVSNKTIQYYLNKTNHDENINKV